MRCLWSSAHRRPPCLACFTPLARSLCPLPFAHQVPCDGVLLSGHDVSCNEGALTGETDDKPKDVKKDPFLLSGTEVTRLPPVFTHEIVIRERNAGSWLLC